jgi:low affinity Fe/Cu permease
VSGQETTRREGDGTTRDRFNQMADAATRALGSIQAVVLSVVVVVVWALSGPLFGFSDSWQLVINTSTTVITFWMVFVIQNSQGRDARAIHLKLDEIIRANAEARNEFIVAERATEAEVAAHERDLQRVVDEAPGTPAPATGSDAR